MKEKKLQYAFRLVHIDNIPHILEHGLVRSDSPNANPNYVPIGDHNGVRRIEAGKIVYCVIRIEDIIRDNIECYFSDGHVLNGLTQVFPGTLLESVDEYVQYDEVFAYRWDDDEHLDLKRRKEAELLLKNDLPVQYIKGFVVYNLEAKQLLLSMGVDEKKVVVKPNYYF